MKHRLIALGTVSTFLLIPCGVGLLLISFAGWLLFTPAEKSRVIKIVPIAPLNTPIAVATQQIVEAPSGLVPAALKQSMVTPTPPSAAFNPTATSSPTVTPSPTVPQKGVATRLVIPKLSLDAPVLLSPVENETWKVDHLEQAVGHLEATAPPGSASNVVLAGHVTLATGGSGPFAQLNQLAPGDMIIVYEGDQQFFYVIEHSQTVERNNVTVTYPTNTGQITLLTCINWNSEEGRYSDRLVVRGRLIKS